MTMEQREREERAYHHTRKKSKLQKYYSEIGTNKMMKTLVGVETIKE